MIDVPDARRKGPDTIRVIRCGDAGLALCVGRIRAGHRHTRPCHTRSVSFASTVVVCDAVPSVCGGVAHFTNSVDVGSPDIEHPLPADAELLDLACAEVVYVRKISR